MKKSTDNENILTLQIGVLMAAVGAIVTELAEQRPSFGAEVRLGMERVVDVMLHRGVSDSSLDLARETIATILSGLPRG